MNCFACPAVVCWKTLLIILSFITAINIYPWVLDIKISPV